MEQNIKTRSKTRLYFTTQFPFIIISHIINGALLSFSYFGSMIVQTLIRRNFGERYFSFWFNMIVVTSMLGMVYPMVERSGLKYINNYEYNWSWVAFALIILVFTLKRYWEVDKSLTAYDDTKFSLYDGDYLRLWSRLEKKFPFTRHPFHYYVTRYLEGSVFIILGLILMLFEYTLIVGRFIAGLGLAHVVFGYVKYKSARNSILEKIDEKIMNEEMYDALVNEKSERGFRWAGPKLEDSEATQIIANSLIEDNTEKASRVE